MPVRPDAGRGGATGDEARLLRELAAFDGTPQAFTPADPRRGEREVALELLERATRGGEVPVCDEVESEPLDKGSSHGLRLQAQDEGILLGGSPAVRRSHREEEGCAAGSLAIGEGRAVVPSVIGAVPAAVPDALAPRGVP